MHGHAQMECDHSRIMANNTVFVFQKDLAWGYPVLYYYYCLGAGLGPGQGPGFQAKSI